MTVKYSATQGLRGGRVGRRLAAGAAVCVLALSAGRGQAQTIYSTIGPGNTYATNVFYPIADNSADTIGFAFVAQSGGRVTQIVVPMARSAQTPSVLLAIYGDSGGLPGTLLGSWPIVPPTTSPPTQAMVVPISGGPQIVQGTVYYLTATVQAGQNASWWVTPEWRTLPYGRQVWIASGSGPWMSEPEPFAAFAIIGDHACYINCDGSTATPILNVNDFLCFLNRFGAGDPYANCDGLTTPPILNVNDFLCFLNLYSAGCP